MLETQLTVSEHWRLHKALTSISGFIFYTQFTWYSRLSKWLYNWFNNRLYTRYSRLSNSLTIGWCLYTWYNWLSNRFDDRLYRVKGALVIHYRIPLLVPALRRQNQRHNEELKQWEHDIEITEMQCKRHEPTESEDDCAVNVDTAVFWDVTLWLTCAASAVTLRWVNPADGHFTALYLDDIDNSC